MKSPHSKDSSLIQIRQLMQARRFDEARALLQGLVVHPGQRAWAHERIAHSYVEQGRYHEALPHVVAALEGPFTTAEVPAALAALCLQLGRMRDADALCAHPLVASSANAMVHASVGHSAMVTGNFPLAIERYRQALALGNERSAVEHGLGSAYTFIGKLDEAERHLEAGLAKQPYQPIVHWNLAKLRRQTPARNHVPRLRARLAEPGLDDAELACLNYALFKELDDLGEEATAWDALMAGGQAMRRSVRYDRVAERAVFDALLETPATSATQHASTFLSDGPQPIFILGLPRSGTTLVDRIVGGHSQVHSAGELNDLLMRVRWQCRRPGLNIPDPALVAAAEALDFAAVGRSYLEHTAWRADGKPFYTDKLPHNFMNIGYLQRALPQARILHLVRNPMDVCWSNLKEYFVGGYFYSNDLDDLAEHYHGYRQLMAHWHARFPGAILDVDYDQLVADPEPWARKILDFCGLPFEAQCLRIEENAAPVATASASQVREGIYRRASGQWRRYEAFLGPLQQRLRDLGYLDEPAPGRAVNPPR